MTTILITAIAGDIAQSIALIVRETFPEWRIVGTDVHDRHGGVLFVDAYVRAPFASSPDYRAWIESLVIQEQVDICIPMSEAELRQFAAFGMTSIAGAPIVTPNARALEVGADKLRTSEFLTAIGVPAPWTISAEQASASTPFPCIFKPRRGAGSKGVAICASLEEAHFFTSRHSDAVLQELLLPDDGEVTCAIYRSADGSVAVLQLLRKLVGGFTGWATVIDNPDVRKQCEQIANSLDLRGSINAQLRLTDRGPRIFEINARFSSTVLLRHRMGYRDVVWTLQELAGEPIEVVLPSIGMTAARTQGATLLPQNSADH